MPKTSAKSPRKRYVFVALALMIIIQLFAVLVSGVSARNNSVAVAEDAIEREGNTTIESILRHLDPAEQSVEVTARLLQSDLVDTTNPGLERYLYTQLAVMPQMTGAFVGYPDGSFVFVAIDDDGFRSKRISMDGGREVMEERFDAAFNLESTSIPELDAYDPTARPWYVQASTTDELVWTDPYVFFSSQQPGVTASKAIRVDGEVVAVVGVDVELSGIASFLDDLAVAQSGEAFVVSGTEVVGAPSAYEGSTGVDADGNVRLLSTDELGVPNVRASSTGEVRRVQREGDSDLVLQRQFPEDQGLRWSVVVRAPEASFTGIVMQQQRMTLLISVGGGLLVLLALAVLWRVTRPISELHQQASTDPLTGLANRRSIATAGSTLVSQLEVPEHLSVLVIDLDGFKALNDSHGHHTGDRALTLVGQTLNDMTRPSDLIGRLGGDEFVIAYTVHSVGEAVETANRLLHAVSERLSAEFPHSDLGASGGITVSDERITDFELLMLEADAALIDAKHEYKGMLQLSRRLVASAAAPSA